MESSGINFHGFDVYCPYCGVGVPNSAGSLEEYDRPSEGDPTVCAECARVCMFTKDFKLRKVTKEDLEHVLDEDPKAFVVLMKTQQFFEQKIRERTKQN